MPTNTATNNNTTTNTTVPAPTAKADPVAFLDQLHVEQVEWNKGHYKTSTDKLLDLLSKCAEARVLLADRVAQRKRFIDAFNNIEEISSSKPLSLTSRIVRYVFRITGNRASAYARVIDLAVEENISATDLPEWVRRSGGIEEVRRRKANGESPKEQKEATAAKALEHLPVIYTIPKLPQELHASADNTHEFSLALVRHNRKSGSGEVLWASANNTLIKQFLAHASAALQATNAKRNTAVAHTTALASDDARISDALNVDENIAAQAAA